MVGGGYCFNNDDNEEWTMGEEQAVRARKRESERAEPEEKLKEEKDEPLLT